MRLGVFGIEYNVCETCPMRSGSEEVIEVMVNERDRLLGTEVVSPYMVKTEQVDERAATEGVMRCLAEIRAGRCLLPHTGRSDDQ